MFAVKGGCAACSQITLRTLFKMAGLLFETHCRYLLNCEFIMNDFLFHTYGIQLQLYCTRGNFTDIVRMITGNSADTR